MPPYTRHPSQIGISSQKWIELVKRLRRVDSLNFPAHTAGDRAAEAFLKQFTFPLEDKISKYDLLIIHLEQHDGKIPRWARSSKHTTARQVQAPSVVEPEKSWTQRVQEKFGSLEEGKKQALQMLQRLYPLRPQHLEEDTGKINALWKSFNMSGELRQQLVFELASKGVIPVWAEQHKNLSMDVNNPDRFKHIQDMTDPQIAGQAGAALLWRKTKRFIIFPLNFLPPMLQHRAIKSIEKTPSF
ncbi:hypothetical protein CCS41_08770 [Candidatus Fukatsuia symbiotica]|uniref:Uncharacterized protein n=1 Tax=Candidatus Fukatsuia symbiotica TaxID=1878942 RepID=A0A2U8I961_9GAMM|nr:hypothetical protein [Candidatus Fukatsuia symbiotica]AWK14544.1 hypothetical protein CCS41_08770 [Candidatus Fukatsuia symbiotica]